MTDERTPKRKVCVVVTARASYSRIRTALEAVQAHPQLELQLVVAASAVLKRYGNAVQFIQQDGFEVAAQVYNILEGENLIASAKSTGLALIELSTIFANLNPDVVVSIADRFETLATGIAASYMNIPLVHVQGGEVTGSIDEKVRHATTKLADIHLVASRPAYERVVRMGELPSRVFVTGCPSVDLAAQIESSMSLDFDVRAKYGGVGSGGDLSRGYIVVLQHPVTTEYDQSLSQVNETLHAVAGCQLPVLWFWPNVDAGADGTSNGIRAFREKGFAENFCFFKHIDSLDFLKLVRGSRCVVGNSSVGVRECAYLGTPVVNIGSRQEGRDRGENSVDVAHDRHAIRKAVHRQMSVGRFPRDTLFGNGDAGQRMAEVLSCVTLTIEKRLSFDSEKDQTIAPPRLEPLSLPSAGGLFKPRRRAA